MNLDKLKMAVDKSNEIISKEQKRLWKLKALCTHMFRPLTHKEMMDKWMSIGSICIICREHFGWRCKKSPDMVCHYYSEDRNGRREVDLINGITHVLPRDHNHEYETTDSCIFCGMPDERK